ncbi:hypothetical protein [Halobacterium zhouii]|uniref:hypothetical protein n=1 Tax=Halobacterium zhouii TaxID=2902624 RepID=UPI001E5F0689|nr:hypothetical protein [Halobacterium zhouii]
MAQQRVRVLGAIVGRYGVLYPGLAVAGAYAVSTQVGATFGTVLFYVFAGAAILTGFGAASSGPSMVADSVGDVAALMDDPSVSDPDFRADRVERWGNTALVKLVLFTLGLMVALTGLTVGNL